MNFIQVVHFPVKHSCLYNIKISIINDIQLSHVDNKKHDGKPVVRVM